MVKRNWLQALCAVVCVLALAGCGGGECDSAADCLDKKGPAPEGKEYQCVDNTCGLRDKSGTGPQCSPACEADEICDGSSGQAVCRTCSATQGCIAPLFCDVAANNGKGVCRACADTGAGTDQGCTAAAPACDPAAGNGAGVCKVCFDSAAGGAADQGCSVSIPMCDPTAGNGAGVCKACVDSAQAHERDLGCSVSFPVCDPVAASGIGTCKACVDSAQGTGTDLGCSDTAPICNTSEIAGRGMCRACIDSAQGTNADLGCSASTPFCDATANSGAGVCRSCADTVQGTGTDLGCGASSPICDTAANSGAGVCRSCADTAQGTGTDLGCGTGSPLCDVAANSGTGACRACLNTMGPGGAADLGCSSPTAICDTAAANGAGVCRICVATEGCPGSQTCNAEYVCEGCVDNTSCTIPGTPICRPAPPPAICVECVENTDCAATRPTCSAATGFCGCTSDAQCLAATGDTDFCDTEDNNTRGECKVCVTDANCASVNANRPFCDNRERCIQCRVDTDCQLSEQCHTATKACVPLDPNLPTSSQQIAAVLSAPNTAIDPPLPIQNTFVTYIKPTLGTDAAGFFLQSEPDGPAIFVSDTTALGMVQVGDRVSLQVTSKVTTAGTRTASGVSNLTIHSRGFPVRNLSTDTRPGLVVNRSTATDLQSAVGTYESELISLTGRLISDLIGSGTGHVAFDINTAGITGTTGLPRLRVPTTVAVQLDMARNCNFTLRSGPLWRFNANAQPSAYEASDLVMDCPGPKLLSARAMSPTEVRLTFDRKLNASTVQAADFTIGSLNVTNAASNGSYWVLLTTDSQTAAQAYTATVTGEVMDVDGKPVDATANSTSFNGFSPPPTGPALVINEIEYDNVDNDTAEYIELYNRGDAAVDLSDIILLLVNGDAPADTPTAQRKEYLRFPLSNVKDASGNSVTSLPPGGYILAAPASYFSSTPPPAGTLRLTIATGTGGMSDLIQNGFGDGMGLLQNSTGTLIDSVLYEPGSQDPVFRITTGVGDRMLSFIEGTRTSASDSNALSGSLHRLPNGSDSNNNNYDFVFLPNSPGAPTP
jgi:hypothetical protein